MIELSVLALTYLKGFALSSVLWGLYIEYSPTMGKVFFRPDSSGVIKFRLAGVSGLLREPFLNSRFWYPENWDINWVTFTQISTGLYMLMALI